LREGEVLLVERERERKVKQRYKEPEREVAQVTISEGEEFYARLEKEKKNTILPIFCFF